MRTTIAAALVVLTSCALPARAQTALTLQWELKGDVFVDARDRGASRAAFTLTNKDSKPLPARGWAIYFNALLPPTPGSERGGIVIEPVIGELFRMAPDASFKGLPSGESIQFEYLTGLIGNVTQAPAGPYIVFDQDSAKGHAIRDYKALPFERPDQQGRAPRVVTPETQYDRNAVIRDVPAESLPPIFPTPQSLQMKESALRLGRLPVISVSADLKTEAIIAAGLFRAHFSDGWDSSTVRLELGSVEGQRSPEAYELTVDASGIRIVGNSRAGIYYGLQSLRSLLPVAGSAAAGMVLPALRVVDAPRFGYRGLHLHMAYNKNPEEPGLFWGGFVDVDKPFGFIPFDYYKNQKEDGRGNPLPDGIFVGKDRLTEYGRENIIGIEACLWSESAREDGRIEYMLMPKLLGVAERAWAPDPDWARENDAAKAAVLYQEAWSRFVNVVGKRELPRLDQEGLPVNYRIPTPGLKVVDGSVLCNLQLPGFTLRYTTDGTEPAAKSPAVRGPIPAKGVVRAAAFDGRGRKGATSTLRIQ